MVELSSSATRGADAPTPPSYPEARPTPAEPKHDVTQLADVADGSAFDIPTDIVALAELKQKIGNYEEADELFRSALVASEPAGKFDAAVSVPALKGLVANQLLRGDVEAADAFVQRLVTAARNADDDPATVLALNELIRLSLSSSAYVVAEPLLLCLLDIKRAKGDDRPEVATVLASLAVVRQGLGQHKSAEELWREVVQIRERTLAPNHFAITSALEHLASACTARGNMTEALQLFQRTHRMRALTLGLDHPSLRFSRERIADLQLQSDELAHLDDTVRRPAALPIEREVLPSVANEIATPAVATTQQTVTPPKAMVQYRELIPPMPSAVEISEGIESLGNRTASIIAAVRDQLRIRFKAILGALGVVMLLVIAQAAGSRSVSKRNEISAQPPAQRTMSSVPVTPTSAAPSFFTSSAPETAIAKNADATASTIATAAESNSADKSARSGSGASDKRNEERTKPKNERNAAEKPIAVPNLCGSRKAKGCVPRDLGARVGEIADANAARNIGAAIESSIAEPTFTAEPAARSSDVVDAGPPPVGARLIGSLPTPNYPKAVRDLDGEVRVRFSVDTKGRPVMSSFSVIASSHPLFTAAVREAVQRMRFEPARSASSDGMPVVDVVEVPFRFKRPVK